MLYHAATPRQRIERHRRGQTADDKLGLAVEPAQPKRQVFKKAQRPERASV